MSMLRYAACIAALTPIFAGLAMAQNSLPKNLPETGPLLSSPDLPPIEPTLRAKFCTAGAMSVFSPEDGAILHCMDGKIERLRGGEDACPEIQNRIYFEELIIDRSREGLNRSPPDPRRVGLIKSLRDGYARLCSVGIS